jgi:two-component system phosphate regulon response regulator PhoB/two-component system alkaline phosphatase synthesis response regulator PhoP
LHLEQAGYGVTAFADGAAFLEWLSRDVPDLVLLDLMLPDMDGFDVCKALRRHSRASSVPILIVSAKCDELDKVLGFELGADDYLTKPFSVKELLVRVKALLRRGAPAGPDAGRIDVGNGALVLDLVRHELLVRGRRVELTFTEFKILELLAAKKGWVFSRDKILRHLGEGRDKAVIDRTIDVHIRHLREKLGSDAHYIRNIRGVGYKLEDTGPAA